MPWLSSHLDQPSMLGEADEPQTVSDAAPPLPAETSSGTPIVPQETERPVILGMNTKQLVTIGAIALVAYFLFQQSSKKRRS